MSCEAYVAFLAVLRSHGCFKTSAWQLGATGTHFVCAIAKGFVLSGLSSISARLKTAAMLMNVSTARPATLTWKMWGMVQHTAQKRTHAQGYLRTPILSSNTDMPS